MNATGPNHYRAYSLHQMRKLLQKAENYCSGDMVLCKWLYRNKNIEYFDEIVERNGGIMEPVMKDRSGDPRSPINCRVWGVFFTANAKRGTEGDPLEKLPYGSSRFKVPLEYLIDPDCYNLYFADFYCVGTGYHYVILVVAEKDSKADDFCGNILPLLDWDDNEFLTYNYADDSFEVIYSDYCVVEIFYTKVVNMVRALKVGGAEMQHNVTTFGSGSELYKQLLCPECNFCDLSENKVPFPSAPQPLQRYASTMNQMNNFLRSAEDYCNGKMVLCKWLYKNKPDEHFDEIYRKNEGIIKPVMKDRGGDPRNPINNRLEAVFFTASVKRGSTDGEPIEKSPYGSCRFQVSIKYMIDPGKYNLYFSDFYCSGGSFHYVSLVVAEADSEADVVCGDCLPFLKWSNNAFLMYDEEHSFTVVDSDFCIIEVLYACEVDLEKAVKKGNAAFVHGPPIFKRVLSKDGGLDKNLECPRCNSFNPSWRRRRKKTRDRYE